MSGETTPAPTGLVGEAQWRRLDPRMLLVHPVNEVVRFLPFIVATFLFGTHEGRGAWWHVVGLAVPIALGLLRYATTTYRIAEGQIELRRGLVQRNVLTAPVDRIRTVSLTSPLIHRALGLAKVRIGTGSARTRGDEGLELDSLALAHARALRSELLHRSPGARHDAADDPTAPAAPYAADDEVLVRFDPRWVRYAPLTSTGLTIAAGALVGASQVAGQLVGRAVHDAHHSATLRSLSWWEVVPAAVIAFVVVVSVLSIVGYVLATWGFTLSRDAAGRSLHVRRGLLTTRETSLEIERIRGLEVHEPLGLRLAGAGRLGAIVTGLGRRQRGMGSLLVPTAPRSVVDDTAASLVPSGPMSVALRHHGPRARRRRYVRAVGGGVLVGGLIALLLHESGAPAGTMLLGIVAPLLGLPLAADRFAGLGHALDGGYLVVRSGSLRGRRDALATSGIIGWNLRQTWFQRRAGLLTLTATTSGGRHGYQAYDVPEPEALALAEAAVPGLLTPFLRGQTILR